MIDRIDGPEVRGFAARAWRTHLDRDVEPETLRRELSSGTLVAAIHATAGRVPDRPALEIDGARMTHGELDERAGRFAGWLRAKAVHAGERVMLVAPNTLETVMAYLGVLRAGATVVLASPALTAPERDRILRRSRATALLGPGASDGRAGAARSGRILRCELTGLADDRSELGQAVAGAPPIRPPTGGPAGRPTLLAFSSGTTGRPKAVPLSDGNLLSSIRAAMLAWRWTDDDVLVHSLPISHQHGLSGVHATLLAGSAAVILPAFDADALCGAVARSRATVLFAVPTIYERLLASGAIARADLGSLRLLVSGSAPLSPRLAEPIRGAVGDLPLERYGTTESGLNVSNPYVGARQAGSVGLPLPGVELAIVGRHGAPVEEGRTGEIVIRGPQVFEGYDGGMPGTSSSRAAGSAPATSAALNRPVVSCGSWPDQGPHHLGWPQCLSARGRAGPRGGARSRACRGGRRAVRPLGRGGRRGGGPSGRTCARRRRAAGVRPLKTRGVQVPEADRRGRTAAGLVDGQGRQERDTATDPARRAARGSDAVTEPSEAELLAAYRRMLAKAIALLSAIRIDDGGDGPANRRC